MAIRAYKNKLPVLGRGVFIDDSAQVIGDVELGDNCSVWPCAVIRGDTHRIRIGHRCSIQDNSTLHTTHAGPFNSDGFALTLGDDITVAHNAVLHGCILEDRILVGIGVTVLDGAVIESETILGAGCLVPPGKRLEGGYLYVGSPAKQARPITKKEREFFTYTTAHYARLKDDYL